MKRFLTYPASRPQWAALFIFFFVARLGWIGLYRSYAVHLKHSTDTQDETYENGVIAKNILAGKGFYMDAMAGFPAGPTAHKPPLYPVLLAGASKLAGPYDLFVVRILQALMMTVATVLLIGLFSRVFGPGIGLLTGLLITMNPVLAKADTFIENTALSIFLSSCFLYYLWRTLQNDQPAPLRTGLFMGLTALANPSFIPFYPCVAFLFMRQTFQDRWLKGVLILLVAGLTILPWSLRNHHVFNRWVPVNSNFPFNIWMGSNPLATGSFTLRGGEPFPIPEDILQQTQGMNEADRNSYFGKIGWRYARSHPAHFFRVRLKAFFYFWMTSRPWMGYGKRIDIINVSGALLMLITACGGWILAFRQGYREGCIFFALFFLSYCSVYTLTHADSIDRYRLVIDPYVLGFSAVFLKTIFEKGKDTSEAASA